MHRPYVVSLCRLMIMNYSEGDYGSCVMTAATLRRENKQQQPLLLSAKFARKFGTLSVPDSVMKTVKLEVPPVSSQNSDGDLGHMMQQALTTQQK